MCVYFNAEAAELQSGNFSARQKHCEEVPEFMNDAESKAVESLRFRKQCQHKSDDCNEPKADFN